MKLFVRLFRKNYAVNSSLILILGYKEFLNQQREIKITVEHKMECRYFPFFHFAFSEN